MSSCMQILQILYVLFLCYNLGPALVTSSSAVFTVFSVTQFTEDNGGADTGSGVWDTASNILLPVFRKHCLPLCTVECPHLILGRIYPQNIHWQEGPSVENLFKHQFVIVSWQNRKLIVDAFYKEKAFSDYTVYTS